MTLLVVAGEGALGAVSRYVVTGWVQDLTGDFFPWGTLLVNVSGSLALGFTMIWLQSVVSSADIRQFIATGSWGRSRPSAPSATKRWRCCVIGSGGKRVDTSPARSHSVFWPL